MAQLASYRRIIRDDYAEDYQELVEQLGLSVNTAFDDVFNALNGRLTFNDNFLCTVTSFRVRVNEEGFPRERVQIRLEETQLSVTGVLVISIRGVTTAQPYANSGISIDFTPSQEILTINNIKGLVPNVEYDIGIIII